LSFIIGGIDEKSVEPGSRIAKAGKCKRRRENPSLKRPGSLVAPEQKCLGR
jgi:hypothetical protein